MTTAGELPIPSTHILGKYIHWAHTYTGPIGTYRVDTGTLLSVVRLAETD